MTPETLCASARASLIRNGNQNPSDADVALILARVVLHNAEYLKAALDAVAHGYVRQGEPTSEIVKRKEKPRDLETE